MRLLIRFRYHADPLHAAVLTDFAFSAGVSGDLPSRIILYARLERIWCLVELALGSDRLLGPGLYHLIDTLFEDLTVAVVRIAAVRDSGRAFRELAHDVRPARLVAARKADEVLALG